MKTSSSTPPEINRKPQNFLKWFSHNFKGLKEVFQNIFEDIVKRREETGTQLSYIGKTS